MSRKNTTPWFLALAGLVLITLVGCAPAEEATDEATEEATEEATDAAPSAYAGSDAGGDEAAARALAESWDATWLLADADAMAALFTEDAVRLPADGPIQQGREAIRAEVAETFTEVTPVTSANPVSALQVAGDWAWTYGTFTGSDRVAGSDEVVEESGRWLSILSRTPEGWRYRVDSWNYDTPYEGEAEPLSSHALQSADGRRVGPTTDVEAIEALVQSWETATVAGDVDAHLSRYAADAVRINDRGPLDVGADAIRATYEATEGTTQEADATIDAIEVGDDWAWAHGHWGIAFTGPDGATGHDTGKWITVLQRTADGWKVKAELWNRNQPLPAPAEAEA
ncbi:MAG TPA: SgcJ/EcaC family oxidoreductase [Thermoanaerobaculia bacterium]|nr:SgcJ/EcaC family oxidoreductase [Thermoanaerobaculia bacterium]